MHNNNPSIGQTLEIMIESAVGGAYAAAVNLRRSANLRYAESIAQTARTQRAGSVVIGL
jgi:hypothetical protein